MVTPLVVQGSLDYCEVHTVWLVLTTLPNRLRVPNLISVRSSTRSRQVKIELRQHGRDVGSSRRIEDFDAHHAALIVVINHDSVRDLRAVLDGAVGEG